MASTMSPETDGAVGEAADGGAHGLSPSCGATATAGGPDATASFPLFGPPARLRPTAQAALPEDYIGLALARQCGGEWLHGVVTGTRMGTLGQRWGVTWAQGPQVSGDDVIAWRELPWSKLRPCVAAHAGLLEDPATAPGALAAAAAVASSVPAPSREARPARARVKSVRARSPEAQPLQPELQAVWKAQPVSQRAHSYSGGAGAGGGGARPHNSGDHGARPLSSSPMGHHGHLMPGHRPPASGFKGVYQARHGRTGFRAEGRYMGRKFTVGACAGGVCLLWSDA